LHNSKRKCVQRRVTRDETGSLECSDGSTVFVNRGRALAGPEVRARDIVDKDRMAKREGQRTAERASVARVTGNMLRVLSLAHQRHVVSVASSVCSRMAGPHKTLPPYESRRWRGQRRFCVVAESWDGVNARVKGWKAVHCPLWLMVDGGKGQNSWRAHALWKLENQASCAVVIGLAKQMEEIHVTDQDVADSSAAQRPALQT